MYVYQNMRIMAGECGGVRYSMWNEVRWWVMWFVADMHKLTSTQLNHFETKCIYETLRYSLNKTLRL